MFTVNGKSFDVRISEIGRILKLQYNCDVGYVYSHKTDNNLVAILDVLNFILYQYSDITKTVKKIACNDVEDMKNYLSEYEINPFIKDSAPIIEQTIIYSKELYETYNNGEKSIDLYLDGYNKHLKLGDILIGNQLNGPTTYQFFKIWCISNKFKKIFVVPVEHKKIDVDGSQYKIIPSKICGHMPHAVIYTNQELKFINDPYLNWDLNTYDGIPIEITHYEM